MVTEMVTSTGTLNTVKVTLVAPARTTTLGRTIAKSGSLLARAITAPPAGAAPLSVTVPCEDSPPGTLGGSSVNDVSLGGNTVSVAVCVSLP